MPYIAESALAEMHESLLQKDEMVRLANSEAVFTIGALRESIENTDVGRVRPSTAKAGVSRMYEENLAGKVVSMTKIRHSLRGDWTHLDGSINDCFRELMRGYDDTAWSSDSEWYDVWNAYASFRGWRARGL